MYSECGTFEAQSDRLNFRSNVTPSDPTSGSGLQYPVRRDLMRVS